MQVAKVLLPPPIRRAFVLAGERIVATFRDAPYVFFAVVIGVALTFRVAIGWVKDASSPPVVAPTFTTTPVAEAAASGNVAHERADGPAAAPLKKDPDAVDGRPSSVRVGPKSRGHGRRGR